MKICENCNKEHDNSYASGRFCSQKCARSFSTKKNRKEINKKISKKLKGQKATGKPFIKNDPRFEIIKENGIKISEIGRLTLKKFDRKRQELKKKLPYELVPKEERKRRLLLEQNNLCGICKLVGLVWNEKSIVLELHHMDGNRDNHNRNNEILICPNCHQQTDNFKFKGKHVSSETKVLLSFASISNKGKTKRYWSKENMEKYGID